MGTISRIEYYGLKIAFAMTWVGRLGRNLYEIRSKWQNNIQRAVYFHVKNHHYVITHGFTKKQQKTPQHEINKGIKIRNNYLKGLGRIKNHSKRGNK